MNNPQYLNRYSYVLNNPIRFNDPTGHCPLCVAMVAGAVGAAIGFGHYAITHEDDFDWITAARWASGGFVIGATLGAVAPSVAAVIGEAAEPAITAAATTGSVWAMGWAQRGIAVERMVARNFPNLGVHLPENFPKVDFWNRSTRMVTSVRSIDLTAKTYQNMSRLFSELKGHVDELARFEGHTQGINRVRLEDIRQKVLFIVTPDRISWEQYDVLNRIVQYAASQDIGFMRAIVP